MNQADRRRGFVLAEERGREARREGWLDWLEGSTTSGDGVEFKQRGRRSEERERLGGAPAGLRRLDSEVPGHVDAMQKVIKKLHVGRVELQTDGKKEEKRE